MTTKYTLKRTRRSQGLRVRIETGGEVIVTAGYLVTIDEIEAFLYQHRRWVATHVRDAIVKEAYLEEYDSENRILLHGIPYDVEYIEGRGHSVFDGTRVVIYTTGDRREALDRWYMSYARAYLEAKYSEIAHDIVPMQVKKVRSYYGICYRGRGTSHIYLNSALVHADDDCIRYVICHELVHLDVPNHSKEFYRRLALMEPRHKELRARLLSIVRM